MPLTLLVYDPDETSRDRVRDALLHTVPLVLTGSPAMALTLSASKSSYRGALISVDGSTDDIAMLEGIRARLGPVKLTAVVDKGNDAAGEAAVRHGASGYVMRPLRNADLMALV